MTALELAMAMGETEDRYAKTVFTAPAKKKLSRPVRTALILAAVLVLLALLLGVAARETGFLERLFPAKYEAIEDYVNHMAVSVENDGLRLTLHEAVTDGYNTMHLSMGYDGVNSRKVCDAGFEYANAIINHCARMMPAPVCA